MYRSTQRICASVETATRQHQHNMMFGNVWILWPRSKQNRKSAENPSLNKFGFRRISSFPFPSSCFILFPRTFHFFFRKFCVRWVTPVVSFKKLRGKFERGQLHVRRFTAVDIRDLKQSGRQRQGRLRLKNKFLPLMRILKMAACVYRLIRRHTSTSA